MLERIETIIYGSKREGGLLNRLNDVERNISGASSREASPSARLR